MLRGNTGLRNNKGLRSGSFILEIGEAYTKCGFAGESSPRFIVPTTYSFIDQKLVTNGVGAMSTHDWRKILFAFLKELYFYHVQVSPADRRVVVCENPFWPTVFKTALSSALFDLDVPSVMFIPKAPLPLYLSFKESGIVIDVGYVEIRVLAISGGFPAQSAMQTCPVGMRTIHHAFVEQVKDLAGMPKDQLDNIVRKVLYVGAKEEKCNQDVVVTIATGSTVNIPGSARISACNTIFGDNEDENSVGKAVLDAVILVPIDARALVIDNLVVSGGTSMLPGFAHRLLQEIDSLIALPRYSQLTGLKGRFRITSSVVPGHLQHYLGAAIVGSMEINDDSFFTKEYLQQGGVIPDWLTAANALDKDGDENVEQGPSEYLIF